MRFSQRTLPLLCMCLALFMVACGSSSSTQGSPSSSNSSSTFTPVTLNVFAAASLTESFNELKTQYHAAHPNVTITYNYNGSQALVQQMTNGAPVDVFASADEANMQKAVQANVVGQSQIFARNKLMVITPVSNPAKINSLHDLARKGVKIDLAAPSVPVGSYALQVLDKMAKSSEYGSAYEQSVKANVISQEDNVKAVLQKVELGEADAGIVYLTDVTPAQSSKVKTFTIPDQYNVIAQYPIAVAKKTAHEQEAQAFVQYLLSSQGQAILAKYHFMSPS